MGIPNKMLVKIAFISMLVCSGIIATPVPKMDFDVRESEIIDSALESYYQIVNQTGTS